MSLIPNQKHIKGDAMTSIELLPIREQLERIEKKLDGNFSNKFLIKNISKEMQCHP